MKTKYLYIAQFLAWVGFTAIDYIENKTSYYIDKVISINLLPFQKCIPKFCVLYCQEV